MTTMTKNKVTVDGIRYATHAAILNELFGKNYKLFIRAEYDLKNGYSVWFPVVTRTDSVVHATRSYNGWLNLLVNHDTEIHQYWPNARFANDMILSIQRRITFAKFKSSDKFQYEFIGVFEKDASLSDMDHTVYRRISTCYPIFDIQEGQNRCLGHE